MDKRQAQAGRKGPTKRPRRSDSGRPAGRAAQNDRQAQGDSHLLQLDLFLFALVGAAALAFRLVELDAVGEIGGEAAFWNATRHHFEGLTLGDLRLVSALLGACGCSVLFLAGRDLIGRGGGLLAGALWAVLPQNVAAGRIVGLEAATSLLVLLAVSLFFRGLRAQREGSNSGYDLAAGACVGLAVAADLANITVVVLLAIMYLFAHWATIRRERRFPVSLTTGLLPVVAIAAFVAAEPRLWGNMRGFGELLQFSTTLPAALHDLPLRFAVTTPVAVLALAVVGLARAIHDREAGSGSALLLLIAPFVLAPAVGDSVGAIGPAIAGSCLLAALGADTLGKLVGRVLQRETLHTPVMAMTGAAVGICVLYASVQMHPYYQLYYNEIVGGFETVATQWSFAKGHRGEGLLEACTYLERNAKKGAKVFVDAGPPKMVRLRSDLKRVSAAGQADFVIHNRAGSRFAQRGFGEVFSVRVQDVPLVSVFGRTTLQDQDW